MNMTSNIIINLYSIIILAVILVSLLKLADNGAYADKLYKLMVVTTLFMLIMDSFSRFDGRAETLFPLINHLGNFLTFLLSPILPSLWLLYIHLQLFRDGNNTRRLIGPLLAVVAGNAIMVILSLVYGFYYTIDAENVYHRGPFFLVPAFITILLILLALVITVNNRDKLGKRALASLLFFPFPPMACIFLQIAFYGASLILHGVVISLLIVFFNIQNSNIYTDHLTGVNNRKKLDAFLKKRIQASTPQNRFSAILLDLDNFKMINDTFGHDAGDKALEAAVALLKSTVGDEAFIARYGGDEFIVILDLSDRMELEATVERIHQNVARFNKYSFQPYTIAFSMGYAWYDCASCMNGEEFIKHLDVLMYANKFNNKKGSL